MCELGVALVGGHGWRKVHYALSKDHRASEGAAVAHTTFFFPCGLVTHLSHFLIIPFTDNTKYPFLIEKHLEILGFW